MNISISKKENSLEIECSLINNNQVKIMPFILKAGSRIGGFYLESFDLNEGDRKSINNLITNLNDRFVGLDILEWIKKKYNPSMIEDFFKILEIKDLLNLDNSKADESI